MMNFVRFRCALLGLLAGTTTACSCGKDDIAQTHATGDAAPSHDARPSFPPPGDAVAPGTGGAGAIQGDAFAPVEDASHDVAVDVAAVSDAEPDAPHPVSEFCGDGIRDPVTEECDDGPGTDHDTCSAECRVTSTFVVADGVPDGGDPRAPERDLGVGRHVIASSGRRGAFALAYMEHVPEATVWLQAYNEWGHPAAARIDIGGDQRPSGDANPVVAALPGGRYAVAWTDAQSGSQDVGIRTVGSDGVPSPAVYAHDSTLGIQRDADAVWTGSELVVAWSDGFDLAYRRFDDQLEPLDAQQPLTTDGVGSFESNVALAPFGSGFAAAWRVSGSGPESVVVTTGESTWTTPPSFPAVPGDHPALVALDGAHLLLVFTAGLSDAGAAFAEVPRVRLALLDTSRPGEVSSAALVPLMAPFSSDPSLPHSRPDAVRVGDRIFVAWETERTLGDPLGTDLILQELRWSEDAPDVIVTAEEFPLIVEGPLPGDQRRPALGATRLFPEGALVTAWEDWSALPGRPVPDLWMALRPVPIVTLPVPVAEAGAPEAGVFDASSDTGNDGG
jgi:cysteine-rich repeat protein